jgi:hypothetical protein
MDIKSRLALRDPNSVLSNFNQFTIHHRTHYLPDPNFIHFHQPLPDLSCFSGLFYLKMVGQDLS